MDIEEFYDQNPQRRSSAEVEWGRDWHDADGARYELSWIEETGELYVMCEPWARERMDPFGGIHVSGSHEVDEKEVEGMAVTVIATVADRSQIETALDGWEPAMVGSDSVTWLVEHLRAAGIVSPDASSSPNA